VELKITFVDAFTDKIFSGNPAAVCILENPLPDELMQTIAAEINLSETAFLYPKDSGYHLRWFTPVAEVKLCGHATLASAHALWERGVVKSSKITFSSLSGELTAEKKGELIELNFPAEPLTEIIFPDGLTDALGASPIYMGKTDVRYFAELKSAEDVRNLKPDFNKLLLFPPGRIIVTAKSDDPRYDFISRYFAPGIGIPEDPVTGSAHCSLALYWSKKLNKNELMAYQASKRGGEMKVILDDDRVRLQGTAVTTMQGTMMLG
jgi:PhzF family phenazine biosynthesis protein